MARAPEKEDSVYDFLYVDTRRIGLLLSQFGQDGVLTELVRQTNATSELGGGFDVKIVKLEQKDGEQTGLTRRFDPQWLTPLLFLDAAKDSIVRDISAARIGQLVLASGKLGILDLKMLKSAWEIPEIRKQISQSSDAPQTANSEARRRAKKEAEDNASMIVSMLKLLPHVVQAAMSTTKGNVWATLNDESLITPVGDIILKHGVSVAGEWSIVGVMDALPNEHQLSLDVQPQLEAAEMAETFGASPVSMIAMAIAPLARMVLGRPSSSYGITPLVIFREIAS